jgi:hypothetical protein
MSYCVNCGVELEKTEKSCPLCGVEVINPAQPYDDKAVRPYPKRLDPINARINRQFIAAVVSICLAFPAVLCLAIDLSLNGSLSWSLYVTGALILVWTAAVPVYLYRRPTLTRLFLPVLTALILYLLLIASMQKDSSWFYTLALPIVLLLAVLFYLNAWLIIHRKVRGFAIPAMILISTGLMTVGCDIAIGLHLGDTWVPDWSFYVLIPCLAVAMLSLAVARRQSIREEIKKRLHL